MKTLFVNPCLRPTAEHRYLPVGLGYIVTAVKNAGFTFDILDIDIGNYDDSYVEEYLNRNTYDVVALGAIVTHYKWIKWFIGAAKAANPGCVVIVGNSVGSSIPEIILAHTAADVVVLGEGDVTIVEVLTALERGEPLGQMTEPPSPVAHRNGDLPAANAGTGIAGIVFRDPSGRIVHTGRRKAVRLVDELPYPDWDLFDVESYVKRRRSSVHDTTLFAPEDAVIIPINTARGCVFKCTFCHYVFWHDPYRHRSPASVIGEMKRNMEKYGANYFEFWDELSFHKVGPAEKFVDALIEADLPVHWSAAIRSDLLGNPEVPGEDRRRLAQKFKQSGCINLGFSLESGSDEILEAMNKRVKAEYFGEQVNILRDVGIIINTSLVVGYPQETPETIAMTMRMCEELRIYPSVGFLLPLPETGMWNHALENGFIKDPEAFLAAVTERQDVVMNMTKMTDAELMTEVTTWLRRLNETFGNELTDQTLIRTGSYEKIARNQTRGTSRHRNTADTLNYATVAGVL